MNGICEKCDKYNLVKYYHGRSSSANGGTIFCWMCDSCFFFLTSIGWSTTHPPIYQEEIPMKENIVLIYSGGADSTCLLHWLLAKGFKVKALGFNYGQRHQVELAAAKTITQRRGVQYDVLELQELAHLLGGSSQTDPDVEVPEGKYDDENMKLTVVPNRNMIMLSIAAGHAMSLKYDHVVIGAHSGDHTIYPDCRPEFMEKLDAAIQVADWNKVTLERPFIDVDKGGCILKALEAIKANQIHTFPRVTFAALQEDLRDSWSCYKGGDIHCGKCGACTERKEAFKNAKYDDPTLYLDEMEEME